MSANTKGVIFSLFSLLFFVDTIFISSIPFSIPMKVDKKSNLATLSIDMVVSIPNSQKVMIAIKKVLI